MSVRSHIQRRYSRERASESFSEVRGPTQGSAGSLRLLPELELPRGLRSGYRIFFASARFSDRIGAVLPRGARGGCRAARPEVRAARPARGADCAAAAAAGGLRVRGCDGTNFCFITRTDGMMNL